MAVSGRSTGSGEQAVFCGEQAVFCGEQAVFCGEQAVFCGEQAVFCGEHGRSTSAWRRWRPARFLCYRTRMGGTMSVAPRALAALALAGCAAATSCIHPPAPPAAENAPGSSPIPASALETQPAPLDVAIPAAEYPQEALADGFEGAVRLKILIDETGRVREAEVVGDPGHGLGQAATRSVAHFRFSPGQLRGKPVATWWPYTVLYELPPSGGVSTRGRSGVKVLPPETGAVAPPDASGDPSTSTGEGVKVLSPEMGMARKIGVSSLFVFPARLRVPGRTYVVSAKICVSNTGLVDSVWILPGSEPALAASVVAGVKLWRYHPLTVDVDGGPAVPFCYVARFEFKGS